MRLVLALTALLVLAPTAAAGPFQSPTRNIGCFISASDVRCDIGSRDWSPPAKPASCDLDYGQGMSISRTGRRGQFICAGDTALDNGGKRLAYGKRIRIGGMTCTSRESGVTCTNARGHGFTLSKQRYKRF